MPGTVYFSTPIRHPYQGLSFSTARSAATYLPTYPVFTDNNALSFHELIGNESVPIQLAQCWFPGLAISSAKISIYFSNKIYGSNFIKQYSETVVV